MNSPQLVGNPLLGDPLLLRGNVNESLGWPNSMGLGEWHPPPSASGIPSSATGALLVGNRVPPLTGIFVYQKKILYVLLV